ncbi:MAG: tetratricopeptide repeat protein [Acidobacteria bacterium]|nr:tetratricopeptide repeat protein [Acidobacteriota bacterium]
MGKRPLLVLVFLCLFSSWGWAQQQQQPPSSSSGQRDRQPQQQQRSPRHQSPLFLSGKIMMEDGGPPTEQVKVQFLCESTVLQQVFASGDGTFGFMIEAGRGALNAQRPLDASISSTVAQQLQGGFSFGMGGGDARIDSSGLGQAGTLNISSCEVQAMLAGFESDRILLGPRRALDNPDIGIIVLYSRDRAASATISLKTLAAPKDAKKAYEKAQKELGKKEIKFDEVTKELEKAVKIYPEFAAAWNLLGEVSLELEDWPAAHESFLAAVAADSQYASPLISLAMLELEEENWEEAAHLSRQALELDSGLVRAHYFNAVASSSLGQLDAAEESVLQIQESSRAQNYPFAHYILGWIMSQKGNFHSAAAEYRLFLEVVPTAGVAEELKVQLAQWEEQGLIPDSESANPQN